MDRSESRVISGRRSFLKIALPGGALLYVAGRCPLVYSQSEEKAKTAGQKHKFLEDSGMTFTEVYNMAYADAVPIFKGLEGEIGSQKFLEMLKRIVSDISRQQSAEYAKKLGKNDLAAYTQDMRQRSRFWNHVLTYQVVEDTPKAVEIKVTECLWAKTFHEAKAAELGYALICYGDYAAAEGFNPKMCMIRTKTLMQGNDCCNHRYVLEG